jgi:hypothetical protein
LIFAINGLAGFIKEDQRSKSRFQIKKARADDAARAVWTEAAFA